MQAVWIIELTYFRRLYSHPLHGSSFGLEVMKKKHLERTVQAGLSDVLSVRLREGYTIKDVRFLKGKNVDSFACLWKNIVRFDIFRFEIKLI